MTVTWNYDKYNVAQLKTQLLNRDAELQVLAKGYLEKEARVVCLRNTITRLSIERAAIIQQNKDHTTMTRKLTNALELVANSIVQTKVDESAGPSSDAASDAAGPSRAAVSEHGVEKPDASFEIMAVENPLIQAPEEVAEEEAKQPDDAKPSGSGSVYRYIDDPCYQEELNMISKILIWRESKVK